MISNQEIIGIFLSGAILYPIGMRVLSARTQRSRLRMVELGKELVASPYLNDNQKDVFDSMLDDAFKARVMVIMAICLPIYVIKRLLGYVSTDLHLDQIKDPNTQTKIDEFIGCHIRVVTAANPLFTIVVTFEVALIALFLFPVGMIRNLADLLFNAMVRIERHAS